MQETDVSVQGTATPGGGAAAAAAGDPGAPAAAPSSSSPTLPAATTTTPGPPPASAGSAPPSRRAPEPAASAAAYEEEHVHRVYESIAPHFSATRHKPWPVIAGFLGGLAPGAVGFDVGCGNGKYLGVNRGNVFIVGADRSPALARLAADHGGPRRQDVAVADGLALPFASARADFALCVAVLHHLSTRARRRDAVRALLDCLRPPPVAGGGDGGRALLYVWALEQSGSRRGWDESSDQDLLVPWVMKQKKEKKDAAAAAAAATTATAGAPVGDTTYQRYYHLFKKGELEEDVLAVGGKVLDHGYDKDNWWVVAGRAS